MTKEVNKGSALAMVLLFVSTFALMTAGVGSLVASQANNVNKTGVEKRTRYAAYAAIQLALQNLNESHGWDPKDTITDIPMPGDPEIKYTLRVLNNWLGTGPVTSSDGVIVPRYMVLLHATGDYQDMKGGRLSSGMASMGYVGDSFFNYAAMGTRKVRVLNQSITDSYKNSAGPKPPPSGPKGWQRPSDPGYERGNVLTNGVGDAMPDGTQDGIEIDDAKVNGNIVVGPNAPGGTPAGPPALRLTNGGTVAYERKVNVGIKRVPRYCPPYAPTGATSSLTFTTAEVHTIAPGPPGYRDLYAANTTLELSPGDYLFLGDVNLINCTVNLPNSNNNSITSIYVGKKVSFTENSQINLVTGRAQNNLGAPSGPMSLRLFWVGTGAPGCKELKLVMDKSSGAFCAAGKALDVSLTDSEVWGSIKGLTVTLSKSKIHYDKDLFNNPKMGMVAWNLQGLTEDSGDTMEDGMGDGGGGDGGGDGGGG